MDVKVANATLYVPEAALQDYKSQAPWSGFGKIISIEVAEAEKFKTDNADILGKTTDNISSSDLDAINKALEDYDKLSDAAKGKLTNEKELLDALKEKAEEITGISSIFINTNDEKCYNLNGQRVNKSAKGLIIKNGKKVVIK